MPDTPTPRTDVIQQEFMSGRCLTWIEVANKSLKLFESMRELERALTAAEEREAALRQNAAEDTALIIDLRHQLAAAQVNEARYLDRSIDAARGKER